MVCEQGDLVWVVSDGVHDNIDPQIMGYQPHQMRNVAYGEKSQQQYRLEEAEEEDTFHQPPLDDWESLPHRESTQLKNEFSIRYMEQLLLGGVSPRQLNRVFKKEGCAGATAEDAPTTNGHYHNGSKTRSLNPLIVTKKLLSHCVEITKAARTFMEENPDEEQPFNFQQFPGETKLVHTTRKILWIIIKNQHIVLKLFTLLLCE